MMNQNIILNSLYELSERNSQFFYLNTLKLGWELSLHTLHQREYRTKMIYFFVICFMYLTSPVKPKFSWMVLSTGKGKKETIHKSFLKLFVSSLKMKSFLNFSFLRLISLYSLMLDNLIKNNMQYFLVKTQVLNNNLFFELNKLLHVSVLVGNKMGRSSLKAMALRYKLTTLKRRSVYYNNKFLLQMKHTFF